MTAQILKSYTNKGKKTFLGIYAFWLYLQMSLTGIVQISKRIVCTTHV